MLMALCTILLTVLCPIATCPSSEMSTTFSQGPTGFLGVAANPLPVVPKPNTLTSWPVSTIQ